MEKINFKIEVFEGPLDLMLHLISKHKLNIMDISISELLLQYMDYIERLKLADLEISSEFLAMASHLVYIKTVSLLPKHDEAQKLKKELEGQLLEYQLFKQVAINLKQRFIGNDIFTRNPQPFIKDTSYNFTHDKSQLLKSYLNVINKAPKQLPPKEDLFKPLVTKPIVSIKSRVVILLNKLYSTGSVSYDEFFYCEDKSEMIASFLAMLELIKSKRISISDDNKYITFNKNMDNPSNPHNLSNPNNINEDFDFDKNYEKEND